jgi:antitoxin (DNA-binding transcriptional repressor) of toxin-antitoxin stability system
MTLKTISVHDLSNHLQELLSLLKEGDEVMLVEGNKPLARLVPVETALRERVPDLHPGNFKVSDDFDEELPDEFWLGEEEDQ